MRVSTAPAGRLCGSGPAPFRGDPVDRRRTVCRMRGSRCGKYASRLQGTTVQRAGARGGRGGPFRGRDPVQAALGEPGASERLGTFARGHSASGSGGGRGPHPGRPVPVPGYGERAERTAALAVYDGSRDGAHRVTSRFKDGALAGGRAPGPFPSMRPRRSTS